MALTVTARDFSQPVMSERSRLAQRGKLALGARVRGARSSGGRGAIANRSRSIIATDPNAPLLGTVLRN